MSHVACLRLEPTRHSTTLPMLRHEAITLARRLEFPVAFTIHSANHLVLPEDECFSNCLTCHPAKEPPIRPTRPELSWEAA